MQVAGNQLRNPPVKFRQERRLHIWRSISVQHVQMEAGLNSDPGNDSLGRFCKPNRFDFRKGPRQGFDRAGSKYTRTCANRKFVLQTEN